MRDVAQVVVAGITPATARVDVLQHFTVTGSGFTGSTQFAVEDCEDDTTFTKQITATQAIFKCTPRRPGPAALLINGAAVAGANVFVDNPVRIGDPASRGIPSVKGVSLWNGNFHHQVVDMEVPGMGLPFVLSRAYNSYYWDYVANRGGTDNYRPWRFNWDLKVGYVPNTANKQLYVQREDGSGETFYKHTDGVWYPIDPGNFDTLRSDTPVAGQTTLTTRDGRVYVFENPDPNPDLGGKLLRVRDHDGHALTLAYGGNDKVATVTDTVGRVFAFTYYPDDLLKRVTDPTGRYVEYTWEVDTAPNNGADRERIKTVRDVRGEVTAYNYWLNGSPTEPRVFLENIVDPNGNKPVRLTYSDQVYGNWGVSTLTDAVDNVWGFTFCAEKDAQGTCDTTDKAVSFRADVTAPIAASSFKAHFDTGGRPTGKTDGLNHRSTVTPYPRAALTVQNYNFAGLTAGSATPMNHATANEHHASGNVARKTNPDGGVREVKDWLQDAVLNLFLAKETWSAACAAAGQTCVKQYMGYDGAGKVTSRRVAALPAATNAYDPTTQLLTQSTDPLGQSTHYEYGDSHRNLTQTTDALGQSTRYVYDDLGRVVRRTDPRGVITETAYDAGGNVLSETVDPGAGRLNLRTVYTYDGSGNQVTRTDPNGNVTTTAYDAANRVTSVTRTVGGVPVVTGTAYDALGRVTRTTNANNHAQETDYDAAGNVAERRDALPRTTSYTYDADNRLETETDPEGRVTSYEYDSMGRVTKVTTPDGFVASTYDKDGRLLSQTDKNGKTTAYEYDAAGRKVTVIDAHSVATRMTYYDDGKLHTVADPRGNVTTYQYDALGRRTRIIGPAPRNLVWETTYDEVGNVKTTKDPDGRTATHTYDWANRLTRIDWSDGLSVAYELDGNGNRTKVTDNTGDTFYTYDEMDRVKTVKDPNNQTVAYTWDGVGNLVTLGYPGGAGRTVQYQYDTVERLTRLTDWAGRATDWTLDRSDRVTRVAHGNGVATDFVHDAAGRLDTQTTRKPDHSVLAAWDLTRDGNGNITDAAVQLPLQPSIAAGTLNRTYDTDNRQTGLSHDAAGRVTHNGAHSFTWNARDQITAIDGQAQTYNAEGQRVAQVAGGATTRFVYDRVGNLPNLLAETDAANSVQRYYLHSPYGLVEQIDAAGNPRWYHYDTNGNTVALTDAAGQLTDAYAYTPFGETTASGVTPNPFRFVGQYGVRHYTGTDLYDMRARWYSAEQGRFMSLDPLLGETDRPQSLNRYAYVEGNPVVMLDPSGLLGVDSNPYAYNGCFDYGNTAYLTNTCSQQRDYAVLVTLAKMTVNAQSNNGNEYSWANSAGQLVFGTFDTLAGMSQLFLLAPSLIASGHPLLGGSRASAGLYGMFDGLNSMSAGFINAILVPMASGITGKPFRALAYHQTNNATSIITDNEFIKFNAIAWSLKDFYSLKNSTPDILEKLSSYKNPLGWQARNAWIGNVPFLGNVRKNGAVSDTAFGVGNDIIGLLRKVF